MDEVGWIRKYELQSLRYEIKDPAGITTHLNSLFIHVPYVPWGDPTIFHMKLIPESTDRIKEKSHRKTCAPVKRSINVYSYHQKKQANDRISSINNQVQHSKVQEWDPSQILKHRCKIFCYPKLYSKSVYLTHIPNTRKNNGKNEENLETV